jgi:hypothetical protein
LRLSFDEEEKSQWDLRKQFGYEICAVDKNTNAHLYTMALSQKNNTLDTPLKIGIYRVITILTHKELFWSKFIVEKIILLCFRTIQKILYKEFKRNEGKITITHN